MKNQKLIGYGYKRRTKNGDPMIDLRLDCRAFASMTTLNIGRSVYIYQNKADPDKLNVMALAPDDYEISLKALVENATYRDLYTKEYKSGKNEV